MPIIWSESSLKSLLCIFNVSSECSDGMLVYTGSSKHSPMKVLSSHVLVHECLVIPCDKYTLYAYVSSVKFGITFIVLCSLPYDRMDVYTLKVLHVLAVVI